MKHYTDSNIAKILYVNYMNSFLNLLPRTFIATGFLVYFKTHSGSKRNKTSQEPHPTMRED